MSNLQEGDAISEPSNANTVPEKRQTRQLFAGELSGNILSGM
jgi:hypothetical protein